jgi:hypothetical protein
MDNPVGGVGLLRHITDGSGVGFCYDIDRRLFAGPDDHGPLLVAWDANVLIDFHTYGEAAINDEPLRDGLGQHLPARYEADVRALADLIHLWFIRDIRFVILPRGEDELDGSGGESARRNRQSIDGLADALTFQLEDWGVGEPRFPEPDAPIDTLGFEAFPSGADRELVAQAARYSVDVFLTMDRGVLKAREAIASPLILRPRELVDRLVDLGIQPFSGGRIDHEDCPYEGALPAPDMGRWVPLLAALES